ncbi:hypothetical protein [Geitlerinema sp. PCC 9228]|nr:hypothetical protein [Geitlerinema sp. PCC 9228]
MRSLFASQAIAFGLKNIDFCEYCRGNRDISSTTGDRFLNS